MCVAGTISHFNRNHVVQVIASDCVSVHTGYHVVSGGGGLTEFRTGTRTLDSFGPQVQSPMQQCGVFMSTVAHQANQQAWHVGALEEAFVSLLRVML